MGTYRDVVAIDTAARPVEHEDGLAHHEGGLILVDGAFPRRVVVGLSQARRVALVPAGVSGGGRR